MQRKILVATDFSPRSDRALRRAVILAGQIGAELSLVHVVDEDQPAYLIKAQRAAARIKLDDTAETIRTFDRIPATSEIFVADIATGLLEAADDVEADFIVLGPHRRRLRDLFVGTTVERAISRSRRPVLVAGGVPSAPYARALIAFDLATGSTAIARRFADLDFLGSADVAALHAYDAPARGMMKRVMADEQAIEKYLRDLDGRMKQDFRRFLVGANLPLARRHALPINGTPARTVREIAKLERASLVVVGTSQPRGFERFVLGSVAADVLHQVDADVLILPEPRENERLTEASPKANPITQHAAII